MIALSKRKLIITSIAVLVAITIVSSIRQKNATDLTSSAMSSSPAQINEHLAAEELNGFDRLFGRESNGHYYPDFQAWKIVGVRFSKPNSI